ncbi:MAG: NADPH:quinone reductase [Pseudonocardia sp.]|nr:NADPH:quinone reductase [Pseudonocardia sp.]
MRAAWIDALGPADSIRYGQLPVPDPGPTDVLVRVEAVAVDPVDTFVRSGAYPTPLPFPFVIGRDLVGTVAVVGAGAVGFAVGDRVWCNSLGHAGRQGAAAEFAVVAADRLYHLPAGVDPVVAVAIAHPGATAFLALVVHGRLAAGETLFVGGGAGHVGSAAIALGSRAGARVIASARAEDLDHCRSSGAAVALDYRGAGFADALRDAAPDGVDVHLETSGQHGLALAVDVLADRGRIVVMAGMAARPVFPAGPFYLRDGRIIGFVISNARTSELAEAATCVNDLLVGGLRPRRIEELPLSAAAEAHRRLETGQARGVRLVLRP